MEKKVETTIMGLYRVYIYIYIGVYIGVILGVCRRANLLQQGLALLLSRPVFIWIVAKQGTYTMAMYFEQLPSG